MTASEPKMVISASLCMTVLNEAGGIYRFLSSVSGMTVTPAEIIIVDGGSSDGTVERIREWEPPPGTTMSLLTRPGVGISAGRNIAIAAASHHWIAVTDAGTVLDECWLEELSKLMTADFDVVSGFFKPMAGPLVQSLIGATITPLLSEINPDAFLPSSRSVAFRSSHWLAVGGYPDWLDYCEDLIFDIRLRAAGSRFAFVGSAVAAWDARPSLAPFAKQYYRYARGDGKSGLWAGRHALRYVVYAAVVGLIALAAKRPGLALLIAVPSAAAYMRKFWRRVLHHENLRTQDRALGIVVAPAIVAVGDVAKMLGYPVGLAWRARHRRSQRDS